VRNTVLPTRLAKASNRSGNMLTELLVPIKSASVVMIQTAFRVFARCRMVPSASSNCNAGDTDLTDGKDDVANDNDDRIDNQQ
jgi:hypothetical protein